MNVTTLKILLLIAFHISTGVLLDSVKGRNRFSIDYCNRPTVSGDQHSASTLLQPFQRIRRRMPVCVCCRTGNNSQFRSDDFQKLCSCRISGTVMSSFQEVHIFKTPILYQLEYVPILCRKITMHRRLIPSTLGLFRQ